MLIKQVLKTLYRSKLKSILVLLTSCMLFMVSYEFSHNIEEDKEKLKEMYEVIPVTGELFSNSMANPLIPLEQIDKLYATGFIKEESLETLYSAYEVYPQANLSIVFTDEGVFHNNLTQPKVLGVSDLEGSAYLPKGIKIEFQEGFAEEDFKTDIPLCLMPEWIIQEEGLNFGDIILLLGEYVPEYYHVNPADGLEQYKKGIPFQLCGSYQIPLNEMGAFNTENIQFIVPARALLNNMDSYFVYEEPPIDLYYNRSYDIISEPVVYTAEFILQNTENLKEFRTYLIANNLLSNDKSRGKYTFRLDDAALESSTAPLIHGISFKENIVVLILILVSVISFLVVFIAVHKRIYDIALMRMAGLSKGKTFLYILCEHMILGATGVFLAFLLLGLRYKTLKFYTDSAYMVFFLMNYIVGSGAAVLFILKMSTMKILLKRES